MKLKILGSSSAGNSYILTSSNKESLILECGIDFSKTIKNIGHSFDGISGCLISHEHGDHAKEIEKVLRFGIDVYASKGTLKAKNILKHHRSNTIRSGITYEIGSFKVIPFHVEHDAAEPLGFLINHEECGNVCFITDTHYVPNRFKSLNNIIVEANYSERILEERINEGTIINKVRNRVLESHMSLETCKGFLGANDLSKVNNIVLIHLSDGNSDAERFRIEVQELTGKSVFVAENDLTIDFNKEPF